MTSGRWTLRDGREFAAHGRRPSLYADLAGPTRSFSIQQRQIQNSSTFGDGPFCPLSPIIDRLYLLSFLSATEELLARHFVHVRH